MSENSQIQKRRNSGPERGGWADYIEARLDMRERTERLRALRLRRQASARPAPASEASGEPRRAKRAARA